MLSSCTSFEQQYLTRSQVSFLNRNIVAKFFKNLYWDTFYLKNDLIKHKKKIFHVI